ncbi:right-handed parallel beta-helix repeat-containing protein [Haloferula sp.]|uniref:right-handed parallel beta-helix repeat-containing protein n=1 Tax=Haloferula sp. TaxID=2497595 RepID=UPI00329C6ABE
MIARFTRVALVAAVFPISGAMAQEKSAEDGSGKGGPLVMGRGVGLFEIGDLIAEEKFDSLKDWVVQIQDNSDFPPAKVEAKDQALNCFVPGRGCTVWFKRRLKTRIAISYDVICPTPNPAVKGVEPKDINNFWMAIDPARPIGGLFNPARYDGDFGGYDKMNGYYASTGGGRNTTTRMRRYPRKVDGKPVDHLALTERDGKADYLITPDKVMRVQLVAYDDVIQYIVDGKLVYEMAKDDAVQVQSLDGSGKRVMKDAVYELEKFPVYREGFFGFRMVGTHHVYSNFRVHALMPAHTTIEVDSIDALREASLRSNQHVVMKPGTYVLRDLVGGRVGFEMSGSDNHFDLSGVKFVTPIALYTQQAREQGQSGDRRRGRRRGGVGTIEVRGDRVTIEGGTFENSYPKPKGPITDFGSYNQDSDNFPEMGVTEIRLRGDDIKLVDCRFTVRGSYPYGYGNMYGIGSGTAVPLRKHCGVLVTGDRVLIEGCYVKMEAFGHAIYVQGGDQITVRNTEVEGEVRESNDFYRETNEGDLAKEFDYKIQWPDLVRGLPVPRDHMINLTEDGIRAYGGTGHMTVENCKVTKTRGGIKLYMAKSATITDCEVRDCVIQGFSIPSRGSIKRSRGNAAYGPLLYVHMDSHSSQNIELEVLPAPHALGDHPLAAIKGADHRIRFTSKESAGSTPLRPIIVGYSLRFDYLTVDFPKVPEGFEANYKKYGSDEYRASDIRIENGTTNPVILGEYSRDNRITSAGPVTDLGKRNTTVSQTTAKD